MTALLLAVALGAVAGCAEAQPLGPVRRPAKVGLPPSVAPLTIALRPGYVVDCLGTLVHPTWVLSAAHCFSDASPNSWVTIREFGASLQVADILVHPEAVALPEVAPGAYSNSDIVAAHDLALLPLKEAAAQERVAQLWRAGEQQPLAGAELTYGRHSYGEPYTEIAVSDGMVAASSLLTEQQPGSLLSATGPAPHGGDSGGGAFWLDELGNAGALMAVVQNAPGDRDLGTFGLVPLWIAEHQQFVAGVIGTEMD